MAAKVIRVRTVCQTDFAHFGSGLQLGDGAAHASQCRVLGQIWDNDGTNLLSIDMNDDSKQKAQVVDSLGLFL